MENTKNKALEKELQENIRKYIEVYDDVNKFINRHQAYLNMLNDEIIDTMNTLGIDSFDKIKKVTEHMMPVIDISELKESFNDTDLIDYLVVRVHPNLTARNLKLKHGFSDKVAKKYEEMLRDRMKETHVRLEIKR